MSPFWTGVAGGGVSGLLTAATVDFQAFRAWKSFDDAASYGWSIAAFRWIQGSVIGALTGAGLFGLQNT